MSSTTKELSSQQFAFGPHTLQVGTAPLAVLWSHGGTPLCTGDGMQPDVCMLGRLCLVTPPPPPLACRRLLPSAARRLPTHPSLPPASASTWQVVCRRLPEEVARVTQTLQLDVEELFANLLDWGTPKPAQQQPQPAAEPQREQQPDAAGSTAQQPAAVDSKKLCGNVESDQPGGLQAQQPAPANRSAVGQTQPHLLHCAALPAHFPVPPPCTPRASHTHTPSADLIGLDVWPASIALCNYLAAHAGLVAGATVCELGAGARVGLCC